MKKYSYIIAAALLSLAACNKEADIQTPNDNAPDAPKTGYVIRASMSDFATTKAEIAEDDGKVTFNANDKFIIKGNDDNWYTFVTSESGASVDFVCPDAKSTVSFVNCTARYPAEKFQPSSNSFNLPTAYSSPKAALKDGLFMDATIDSEGKAQFGHHLMGMVKITLNAVPAYADNVYFENGSRVTTISLDGASGDNVVVYCPIFWQAGALSVSLRDASNNVIMKKSTTVPYNQAGKLYALKPLAITTYTVAGNSEAFGTNWDVDDNDNNLILDSDGLYKKTITNVPSWISFKIVENHSWSNASWPSSNYVLDDYEYVGGNMTIIFNDQTKEVSVEGSDVGYTVAGLANLCGEEWKETSDANDVTEVSDGVYHKKFTSVPSSSSETDGVYQFKVVANHHWKRSWGGEYGSNFIFSTKGSDVDIYFYPAIPSIKVVCDYIPKYRIAGSSALLFGTTWDTGNDANLMTDLGNGTYQISYNCTSDETVNFKVTKDNSWSYAWPSDNYSVTVTNGQTLTIFYNPTICNGTVTVE